MAPRSLQASFETSIASGTVSGSGTLGRAGLKPHPHLPPTPWADSGQMPRLSLPHPGALWPPRWSCPACHGSGPLVQREHCWPGNPNLNVLQSQVRCGSKAWEVPCAHRCILYSVPSSPLPWLILVLSRWRPHQKPSSSSAPAILPARHLSQINTKGGLAQW